VHEVAIAEAIVELVAEHAARDAFRQVRRIHLAIGALSHVDPRALEFGFAAVASGTVADGATLVIDRPPGVARCLVCQADVAIAAYGDPCPTCGGAELMAVGGAELRVIDLEVL
jgi:hydrogenase nickel incorporation protein HypA/HybF